MMSFVYLFYVLCEDFLVFIIYLICVHYISCCKKKVHRTSCLKEQKHLTLSHVKV